MEKRRRWNLVDCGKNDTFNISNKFCRPQVFSDRKSFGISNFLTKIDICKLSGPSLLGNSLNIYQLIEDSASLSETLMFFSNILGKKKNGKSTSKCLLEIVKYENFTRKEKVEKVKKVKKVFGYLLSQDLR